MSMISKLKSVPLTIAPESQPDLNNVQQPQSPVPSTGVANTTDSFESAVPMKTGIFKWIQQQPSGEGPVLQSEATVNAAMIFDYVAAVQKPQPPAPPEPPEKMVNDGIAAENSDGISNAIDEIVGDVVEFATDDRVSARLSSLNSKSEIQKSEAQDAEARLARGYSSTEDMLKEMRK